ncbi:hypothetical protein AGMMS50212_14660 [Spirochaetia bacterium]|nr:hypothetical protein AGMMS50212_14660 [Spirochaetia bacterium]
MKLTAGLFYAIVFAIIFSGCTNKLINGEDEKVVSTNTPFPVDLPASHIYYINTAEDLEFKIDRILNAKNEDGGTNTALDPAAVFFLGNDIEYTGGPLLHFEHTPEKAPRAVSYLEFKNRLNGNGRTITINGGPLFAVSTGAAFDALNVVVNMNKFPKDHPLDILDEATSYRLRNAGALVGSASSTTFTNVSARGSIDLSVGPAYTRNTETNVGGIAGIADNSGTTSATFDKCGSSVKIQVKNSIDDGLVIVGGIVGANSGTLKNSYYASDNVIKATGKKDVYIGGIAGLQNSSLYDFYNCYVNGRIDASIDGSGNVYAGGLVGTGSVGNIHSCLSALTDIATIGGDFIRRIGNLTTSSSSTDNYGYSNMQKKGATFTWDGGSDSSLDGKDVSWQPAPIDNKVGFTSINFYNADLAVKAGVLNTLNWGFVGVAGSDSVWDMSQSYLPIIGGHSIPSFTRY